MKKNKIELTDSQVKKYEDWKKSFGKLPNIGATGGHFGLNITFTSIAVVVIGTSWSGHEIDLTEYEKI
jgi:hypothetical protein